MLNSNVTNFFFNKLQNKPKYLKIIDLKVTGRAFEQLKCKLEGLELSNSIHERQQTINLRALGGVFKNYHRLQNSMRFLKLEMVKTGRNSHLFT